MKKMKAEDARRESLVARIETLQSMLITSVSDMRSIQIRRALREANSELMKVIHE